MDIEVATGELERWRTVDTSAPVPADVESRLAAHGDTTVWDRVPVWGQAELAFVPGRAHGDTVTDMSPHRADRAGPTTACAGA